MATTRTRYWRADSTTGGDGSEDRTDGATRAYESLAALISAEAGDLTAATGSDEILHAICTQTGEEPVGAIAITGFTTAAASNRLFLPIIHADMIPPALPPVTKSPSS